MPGMDLGFPSGSVVKNSPAKAEDADSIRGSGRYPAEGNDKSTAIFLPGKFHGQWSLAGCSLWDHKESNTTE